jgi:hypothetical protein
MRIKYTSMHSVMSGNSAAPWVGAGLAERLKQEALFERETGKKQKKLERKKKGERALGWLRRSR